ncbi:MAG: hypothetical protein AAF725_11175 [Acidobacteriota bacterium]
MMSFQSRLFLTLALTCALAVLDPAASFAQGLLGGGGGGGTGGGSGGSSGGGGGGLQSSCWRHSQSQAAIGFCNNTDPLNPSPTGAVRLCIEWESNGFVTNTACCSAQSLQQLPCAGTCLALERPLLMAPTPSPEPPAAALKSRQPTSLEEAVRAVRPKLPVHFRGRVLTGDRLAKLDGLDLHYLFVLDDGTGQSALYALTDRQELFRAVSELDRSAEESVRLRQETEASGGVSLFADEMAGHASYFLAEGTSVDFSAGWWKDRISSLRGVGAPTWVTLYAGGEFSGSSLTFSTAWDRPTFEAFDWNDRTRSAYVWDRSTLRAAAEAAAAGQEDASK